ncbi:MAG: O-antigen polymerase [Terriglobales bacterium]
MTTVYMVLLLILLPTYLLILIKVGRHCGPISPLTGWLVGLGYFTLAPLALITMHGGYRLPEIFDVGGTWGAVDLSSARFLLPYLTVWLSMMGALAVVYLFLPRSRPDAWWRHIGVKRLQKGIVVSMAVMFSCWALLIWMVGGVAEFLVSHWYARTEELVARNGDLFVLWNHLATANQIVFCSAAVLHTVIGICRREMRWRFTLLVWLVLLLEVVVTGNRIFLAIYLLGVVATLCCERRWKVVATMLACAPILVFVFSMWSSVRHNLSDLGKSTGDYLENEDHGDLMASLINVTEGMNVLLLFHIVDDYGNRVDYLHGLTYARAFISLVPRQLLPAKPHNFTALMAERYLPNVETSLNATAIGEMYANFGPLTLFLFPVLTGAVIGLSQWSSRAATGHPVLHTILFVVLLWAARSTIEDNFVAFLLCVALVRLFQMERGLTSNGELALPNATLREIPA